MSVFSKYMTDDYEHNVYEILGIKFKFKNPHRNLYRRVEGINKLLDYVIDINNLPIAKGELREIQLQVLEILKLIDSICKKHNINYWLDFGTLLGAARHKGFIPWDDDVDICVIRDEYEKLLEILHKELSQTTYYVRERWEYGNSFQIRVNLKDTNIGLDIFPVDKYIEKDFSKSTNKLIYQKFERARFKLDKKWKKAELSPNEIQLAKNDIKVFMENERLTCKNNNIDKPVLFYGIDYYHKWKYKSFEWETIFPLKTLDFEGCTFSVPNKYEDHLTGIYGNWHVLPKRFDNIDYFWKEY
jgi:lipopolysaccharide cholinephosphotransferase